MTPHPLAAAIADLRAEELRAQAALRRDIKRSRAAASDASRSARSPRSRLQRRHLRRLPARGAGGSSPRGGRDRRAEVEGARSIT